MAAEDNIFGAPTEGLGQTVTFAPPQEAALAPMQLPGDTSLGLGIQGGAVGVGATRGRGVPQAEASPLLGALLNLGGKVIQQKQEAAKTAAFVEGMQRAAAGEAISDIVAETPWWAKMLGSADPAEGARWYAGHTVAQTAVADLDERMDVLRALPPDQAREYITKDMQGRLTGDASTDAAILQQASQALPAVFKRHAKSHLGYLNEQAVTAMQASMHAAGRDLQNKARGFALGEYSKEDLDKANDAFLAAMLPPSPDMNPGTHAEVRINGLLHLANAGNLHAFSSLERTGFIETLSPEQQDRLNARIAVAESKARGKFAETFSEDIARITVEASAPREGARAIDLQPMIDKVNRDFRLRHGSSGNYYTKEEEAALLSRSAVAIRQAQERAWDREQTALDKAQAGTKTEQKEAATHLQVRRAMFDGSLPMLATRATSDDIDRSIVEHLSDMSPEERIKAQVSIFSSQYPARTLKQLNEQHVNLSLAGVEKGIMSDSFLGVYKTFSEMYRRNPDAAVSAYGEYGKRMASMHRAVTLNKLPEQQAFLEFVREEPGRPNLNPKQTKAAISAVAKTVNPAWHGFSGDLDPGSAQMVMSRIEPEVASWVARGFSTEEAVRFTLKGREDMEFLGSTAVVKSPTQRKISDWLTDPASGNGKGGVYEDKVTDVFKGAVRMALFGDEIRKGIVAEEPRHLTIHRLPDSKSGVPQLRLSAISQNYDTRTRELTGDQMLSLYREWRTRAATPERIQAVKPNPLR